MRLWDDGLKLPSQYVILLAKILIWLTKMLTTSVHDEKLASQGKNYQTKQIFVSRPREAKFSPKFCRIRAEKLSELSREPKSLAVYLKCAPALTKKKKDFWRIPYQQKHRKQQVLAWYLYVPQGF